MRRKLRNQRPKALFGEAAAAGIQVAGMLAAAKLQADAARKGAEEQSRAIISNAEQNSLAIQQQNDNNTQLQRDSQAFIKAQNDENRQLQKDWQMNLQLLAGDQNARDRREASKIQVKYGGIKRKRIGAKGLNSRYFLRGDNTKFTVTDGGGVIPIGTTPEGYNLYELYGNDHEHYHKTRGGKNKTGVGIKFEDGNVVEGEGNQNSSSGELLLTTPNDAFFISKHSIAGFNPAKAVKSGMHPIQASNIQENLKDIYGINDDGKSNNRKQMKRRTLRLAGGTPLTTDNISLFTDNMAYNMPTTIPYIQDDYEARPIAKCGRRKAPNGTWWERNGNWIGAGATAIGNLGGALLNTWGNNRAANVLADAYGRAGQTMAEAYRNLKTVDIGSLDRNNFRASHYMPVVRSTYYNANPDLENVNRLSRRRRLAINNNTLSSAARLSRLAATDSDAYDMRNKIYADKANREEQIKQNNIQSINEAAARNAELDIQGNRDYTTAYLNLLQYNNDIENQRILGSADSLASALTNQAQVRGTARQANGQAWGEAIKGSLSGVANQLSSMAKQRVEYDRALVGADVESKVMSSIMFNDSRSARSLYNAMKDIPKYSEYATMLKNKFGFQ